MNGASAEPCVSTMKNPSNNRINTIGPSHHFLRILMNAHNSPKIANLLVNFLVAFTAMLLFLVALNQRGKESNPAQIYLQELLRCMIPISLSPR
jgi:hypothetical protein